MRYEIQGGNAFPAVKVWLKTGEMLKAESNAMVAMSGDMELKGKVDGGFGKAFARLFSGESFFMQHAVAQSDDAWILVSGAAPGQIHTLELDGTQDWVVQKHGFLAGSEGIEVSTKVQSLVKGMFSREGLFVVKLSGQGTAFLAEFGAVMPIELAAGEEVLVDNGHLVAWPASMQYKLTKGARSLFSSFTSGEMLACRFRGPGTIYIQTRSVRDMGLWITPYILFPKERR